MLWINESRSRLTYSEAMHGPEMRLLARVPRYTSYPTAVQFHSGIGADEHRAWIERLPAGTRWSLYVHIPFCAELCWFCACHTNVANTYRPVATYLDLLLEEIGTLARLMGKGRRLAGMHWGGGSPTILAPADIRRLADAIRATFSLAPDFAFSAEIDPRTLEAERTAAFGAAGLTRASLGLQELDPAVQRAIHRWQPLAVTKTAIARLRAADVSAFNIDLMYGLPLQTAAHVRQTAAAAAELGADRVSVFGYAHVPSFKAHQQMIDARDLPTPAERLAQALAAHETLRHAGYLPIGLDHYARPDDALARAAREGRLRRGFQGYSEDEPVILGVGASAISTLPDGYIQNAARIPDYRAKILADGTACARGVALSAEDRVRGAIIERLMCDLEVDVAAVCACFGRSPTAFEPEWQAVAALARDGLCRREGARIVVPEAARHGVRLVAAAFDAYLAASAGRHALAV
ncbi:MAG: oxygen-independent coproporphyrinogen III oxidase [Alphaproteobacteria bacterium]